MIPNSGVLKCRKCSFEKKPSSKEAVIVGGPEKPMREMTIIEGREEAGLPTTEDVKCRRERGAILQVHCVRQDLERI
jgi:DNA-directed RNA polymerase subunit M